MVEKEKKILIPYDFSEKSDYAVKHAVQIAKVIEGKLAFLHIIPDLSKEAETVNKLKETTDHLKQKYGLDSEIIVRPGKVSKAIKQVALTIDAYLVVMKTDKPSGANKYLGSRSIRVMAGSKIPFLVIQEPPKRMAFRKVVFPIDFRKENKEKLIWISYLSRFYTSKIFLFKPKVDDTIIKNNLEFAKRFLEGKNIDYEIVESPGRFDLAKHTIEFAGKIEADLIIIMLNKHYIFNKILLGNADQEYLTNKGKTPILCLNRRTDLRKYGGFS